MSYNKRIAPGILVKFKKGLGNFGDYEHHSEDHFYILTEIKKTKDRHEYDVLVFYGLTEERFFRRYRWYIEKYIEDGFTVIVA